MRRRRRELVASCVLALLATGCVTARTFRVTHHHAPAVQRASIRELVIVVDGSDAHDQLARTIAARLSSVLPARVSPNASDGHAAATLGFECRRSTRLESASPMEAPAYTQPLDGRAFTSDSSPTNATSTTVVYEIDLRLARAHLPPRTFRLRASAVNADPAQADRMARDELAQSAVEVLTSTDELVALDVGAIERADLAHAVDAALDQLDAPRCAAIEAIARSAAAGRERSIALFAAGRCEHALAIASSNTVGVDRAALDRAIRHYESAWDQNPDRRYSLAASEASRLREALE